MPLCCPQCGGSLNAKSLECPICRASLTGCFRLPFLSSLSSASVQVLLALVAAHGRTGGVANLLNTHRNNAAGVLAQLHFEMKEKAKQTQQNDPDAALFLNMCERIENAQKTDNQERNSNNAGDGL